MKSRILILASVVVAAGVVPLVASGAGATPEKSAAWQPEAATYGTSTPVTTSVTMDDGVSISVEVVYPTDPATGARVTGDFPVLLTQNPYGTGHGDPTTAGDYFVQRGYIYVASAVRGTGSSGGQLSWFGARQGKDGAELVDWAARTLSGSDGKVGLDGCSYLGVDQWFTAAAVGDDSALKAITPFCTDSDFYDDLTADGGIPTPFVAGIGQGEPRGPQDNPATDPQSVTVAQEATGGADSYNDDYWKSLDVQKLMQQIVANGIPALSEAGWNDLFPGGDLGDYVAAQNAYFHRPLTAPITANEPVTGRYQAIVGPWTHGENVNGTTLENIRLEWFDNWLKGEHTGIADTSTPLHLFENTASQWVDTAAWPPSPSAQTYYLGSGSSLSPSKSASSGTGTLNRAAASTANSLTYTSAPLTSAAVLDGPSDLTVYAASTATEVELSATLNVVASNGTVVKQADGVLLGSQRALDPSQSWYGTGGTLLTPSHPFTQASQQPVIPGQTTRYDISLLANFTEIPAGDRIQVVVTSQTPANFHAALVPTPQESANLASGVYTVDYGAVTPSALNLPLASPAQFTASPTDWGPSS
ncbi:CocE/NonD family hydrolase [Actinospica sp.]|uniref:CocE/NonD family hydrolase n=1 Tax=Actinospica sp. TaxID=1872142 RepID=UPI002C957BB0|nr:CocE/NonD family hydrolase [Actinospica sp.]HWG26386.1 CocE/NonD family hydrolase [Actinospica sp.]